MIGGCAAALVSCAFAGPYSVGLADSSNAYDAPVPGFVGSDGIGKAKLDDGFGGYVNPNNSVNPLFFAWADDCPSYVRSDGDASFNDPDYALGAVTGDNFDVVALGDLSEVQIAAGGEPGTVTLSFSKPIYNYSGADFVVFENSFTAGFDTGGSGVGGVFAELAYVEVSADGVTFHRFNPVSLTPASVGSYGSINPTDVFNLAGKHINSFGDCWGTPFDIGQLGLESISYIRLVDIPGNGAFTDGGGNPIYDSWRTFGAGGFDLEAVGSISTRMTYDEWPVLQSLPASDRGTDDFDGDGIPNLLEYAFGLLPYQRDDPGAGWRFERVDEGGEAFIELISRRDERLIDLTREVQVSEDMVVWTTIARSTAGASYQAVNGFTPVINESSAGNIASVGVMREDRIRDSRPQASASGRYYRLRVTQNESSL